MNVQDDIAEILVSEEAIQAKVAIAAKSCC